MLSQDLGHLCLALILRQLQSERGTESFDMMARYFSVRTLSPRMELRHARQTHAATLALDVDLHTHYVRPHPSPAAPSIVIGTD